LRGHFHEVHLVLHGERFGAVDAEDTQLLVTVVDDTDFGGANLVVDPKFPKSR
jgi:hypothetical protein